MSEERLGIARRGFDAWQRGEFDTIEAILDPDVSWHWWEQGDWNCNDRSDVMRTLRDRYDEGLARAPLELVDAREDVG